MNCDSSCRIICRIRFDEDGDVWFDQEEEEAIGLCDYLCYAGGGDSM